MQGVGAVFGAIGSFMAASANQSLLRGQAEIADINARMAEADAQSVLFVGQRTEQAARRWTAGLKGKQRAAFAAGGVDLAQGSALRVLTDTDVLGEMDANQIQANAVREAWGHRIKATSIRNDALMKRAGASAINPLMAGATSLLGSAGQVAQNWYQMDKVGAFGNGSGATKTTGDFAREDRASATYWG